MIYFVWLLLGLDFECSFYLFNIFKSIKYIWNIYKYNRKKYIKIFNKCSTNSLKEKKKKFFFLIYKLNSQLNKIFLLKVKNLKLWKQ